MKQPLMFDVPKAPTKRQLAKQLNGIVTHYSSNCEMPWMAAHMPSIYKMGYGVKHGMSVGECFSLVCRLIEEAGYCAYGNSEDEAIIQLCKQLGISIIL